MKNHSRAARERRSVIPLVISRHLSFGSASVSCQSFSFSASSSFLNHFYPLQVYCDAAGRRSLRAKGQQLAWVVSRSRCILSMFGAKRTWRGTTATTL